MSCAVSTAGTASDSLPSLDQFSHANGKACIPERVYSDLTWSLEELGFARDSIRALKGCQEDLGKALATISQKDALQAEIDSKTAQKDSLRVAEIRQAKAELERQKLESLKNIIIYSAIGIGLGFIIGWGSK